MARVLDRAGTESGSGDQGFRHKSYSHSRSGIKMRGVTGTFSIFWTRFAMAPEAGMAVTMKTDDIDSGSTELRGQSSHDSLAARVRNGIQGMMLGDALAMPVHWYYDTAALVGDYGRITTMVAPKNPHPGSILWRSSWDSPQPQLDILHDQRPYWGQRGIHYHQFLSAGENTLNLKLARLAIGHIRQNGRFDRGEFTRLYIDFLTRPDSHNDTYLEECHRNFFTRLGKGFKPGDCGSPDEHIGGVAGMPAVFLLSALRHGFDDARIAAMDYVHITHRGNPIDEACALIMDLMENVLRDGVGLAEAIDALHSTQKSPLLGFPMTKWLDRPVHEVIGRRVSPACYLDQSIPASLYLARKYHDRPDLALIENTMAGGDNCHRGAVIGALIGCSHAVNPWPVEWVEALVPPLPPLD